MPRTTNDLDLLRQQFARFEKEGLPDMLRKVARFADARISARAVSSYMRNAGGEPPERSPSDGGPLRIVSGRLARAVSGKGREAVTTLTLDKAQLTYTKQVNVPYAAIHEFGGTIRVQVTPRMRRFFWAKHFETGEDKWMGMALTRKRQFTITITARPYLGPALTDELPRIEERATKLLNDGLKSYLNA